MNDSRKVLRLLCLLVFSSSTLYAGEDLPSTNSSVTFLYYKDLAPAEKFYGEVLGFEKDFDGGWVKIFRVAEGGRVGLVDEKKGTLKSAAEKPVMFSIDTSNVDAWYERVLARGEKYFVKHLKKEPGNFVRAFLLKDPGGYHVEFFQWPEKDVQENN